MGDVVDRVTRKNQDLVSTLPLTISAQYGLIDQREFFDKRVASKDVSGYYLVKKGEFAYNKSTSSDAPWGAIKRLDRYENGVLSTLYIVFAINENAEVDSDYLVTYYDTDLWHGGIREIAAEGARNHGLLNVAPADFFETSLKIPQDIEEQKAIGKYFSELDTLITLHQRNLNAELNKYSCRFMLQMYNFKCTWEQRKVTELGKIFIGLVTTMTEHYTDEGALLIRNSDIKDGRFEFGDNPIYLEKSFAQANSSRMHQLGDVVTVHTGDVGTSAVIRENQVNSIGFATIVTRPNTKIITSDYLCTYLNTDQHKKWAVGVSTGDGRTNYNLGDYYECVVPVPTIEEQQKISEFISNLNNLITLHQRKYVKLCIFELEMRNTDTWEQRKLGQQMYIKARIGWQALTKSEYLETGDYYLITGTDIDENSHTIDLNRCFYVSKERYEMDEKIQVREGDIIVTKDGTIGKVAMVTGLDRPATLNSHLFVLRDLSGKVDNYFLLTVLNSHIFDSFVESTKTGSTLTGMPQKTFVEFTFFLPDIEEQKRIASFFQNLDHLITLHQRKSFYEKMEVISMLDEIKKTDLFCDYYARWIVVYKQGAIRKVTLDKYYMTHQWLLKLVPNLRLCDVNRIVYQQLINEYAIYHERQTTMDFHHQLKGAILDAVDEGLIDRDPTRKAIIKGKTPSEKKLKYLNQFQLHTLLNDLDLKGEINWDWFILLVAKTGMRFSEALAITPRDFDFAHQALSISKTWDYKGDGGFLPTKNKSSVRKLQIDWQLVIQFSELVKGLPEDKPIFVNGDVYNSTVNDILARHCKAAKIPVISVHGLRHTHASLLLFAGVSIASVARRLGHASMTTTQKTYLHIIQELENKDVDLVMRSLSSLS